MIKMGILRRHQIGQSKKDPSLKRNHIIQASWAVKIQAPAH
jgi:hypothetical protein